MTNYREILRLSSLGFNNTQITQSCRVLPNYRHSDAAVGTREGLVMSLAGGTVGQTAGRNPVPINIGASGLQNTRLRVHP